MRRSGHLKSKVRAAKVEINGPELKINGNCTKSTIKRSLVPKRCVGNKNCSINSGINSKSDR